MKIAVSVPQDVFDRAERLARREGRSRSDVYSAAVREYVARHAPDEVVDALDRVVAEVGGEPDAFVAAAARRTLGVIRVVISQGDVWWAELGEPVASEPGFRRPVVVVQGDDFNRSALPTVVTVSLTSNLRWADAPGNVRLTTRATGLPRDSVANVSQIVTLDKAILTERVGRLPAPKLELVLAGTDRVLGR